ncbi:MAG: hypothetical protein NNA23_13220 [Nitrospira sp.]|nr:hypothetical protein [Nitrospira sp.]
MASTLTTPLLTVGVIEETISSLPIQGRVLIKLLLIQYFDISHDEILYMVADRPDPRCVSGTKPVTTMTQESIAATTNRWQEYRRRTRLRRERTWLQCTALKHLADTAEALADRAASLLKAQGVASDTIATLKVQARTAVAGQALRTLDERWTQGTITAEEFRKYRLAIELQTLLRFAERFRKRLVLAERERQTSDRMVLQDHEVCHIWGIPAGSFAGRKVKFLSQYLLNLQAKLAGAPLKNHDAPSQTHVSPPPPTPPLHLWDETLTTLASLPVERSIAVYDGLERTESALLEKLSAYALIALPEATESKFWNSLVLGASSNAVHSEPTRSLFGLQRLVAIQQDLDRSPEALEQELLKRTAPPSQEPGVSLPPQTEGATGELTEMQKQILHNFIGEDASGRASDKW